MDFSVPYHLRSSGANLPTAARMVEIVSEEVQTFAEGLGLSIEVTPTSLTFPADTTPERWEAVGALLAAQETYSKGALPWYIGDWLLHGKARLGDVYQQALDATGWSEQTLMNCKFVASRVPPERRRAALSHAHHAEVAGLPPSVQERLLTLAVAQQMTRDEFRAHIRNERTDGKPLSPPVAPSIKVALTVDGLETVITQLLAGPQQAELAMRLNRPPEALRFAGAPSARRFAPEVQAALLDSLPVSVLLAAAQKRVPTEAPAPYTFKLAQLQKWAARHEEDHPEPDGPGALADADAPPLGRFADDSMGGGDTDAHFRLLDVPPEATDLGALEPEFGDGGAA